MCKQNRGYLTGLLTRLDPASSSGMQRLKQWRRTNTMSNVDCGRTRSEPKNSERLAVPCSLVHVAYPVSGRHSGIHVTTVRKLSKGIPTSSSFHPLTITANIRALHICSSL